MSTPKDTEPAAALPSTIPPPRRQPKSDPLATAIAGMRGEVREMKGGLTELTKIARDCFEHLLIQEGRMDKLERRMDLVEARITLLPPAHPPNGNAA